MTPQCFTCAQDKPVSKDVDVASLARRTAGFSGADLSNLVNEAALAAGKGNFPDISSRLLDEAQDKILMGTERRRVIKHMMPLPIAGTSFCSGPNAHGHPSAAEYTDLFLIYGTSFLRTGCS
jgi:hypothetical protein